MPEAKEEGQGRILQKPLYAEGINIPALIDALDAWYKAQHLEVQLAVKDPANQHYVLQCRTQQGWRRAVGMGNAVNVEIQYVEPRLSVTISDGAWGNVAAAGAAGVIGVVAAVPILAPLAGTAAVGMYRQKVIQTKALGFIEDWVTRQTGHSVTAPPAEGVNFTRTARDFADDYDVLRPSAPQPSESMPVFTEDDLVVSDFDPSGDEGGGGMSTTRPEVAASESKPCLICGASTETGRETCPNGHRMSPR